MCFTFRRLSSSGRSLLITTVCLLPASSAFGWDEEGHIIVTRLAIEALPETTPGWLQAPQVRARLVYLSSEPDRWRGQHNVHLDHINKPDHYIDEELLFPYGLSIKTLPPLRREFTDVMATQRALHPEKFPPYKRENDHSYTRLSPGMLPYRIAELQWKLASSWTTLKTYEAYRDYVTEDLIDNARRNVVYHMGVLSHYVGDGAQPLHLTKHYNGWSGTNPEGYTTSKSFHRFIDGGVLRQFAITADALIDQARAHRAVSQTEYWAGICGYLYETYEHAEPLYALEKSGDLNKAPGKAFIEQRLLDGGAMLAGIWIAAREGAVIDDFRVGQLKAKKRRRKGP